MEKITDVKFKELLSRLQKEVLKAKGFKKSGSNFRLFLPDGTSQMINLQKSQFNDQTCSFTLNVGIYFQKDPQNPYLRFKEYECAVRTRVAGISSRYVGDKWWEITDVTDSDQLYSEFFLLMTEDILPWLEQLTSRRDVIRAGQSGKLRNMIWGNVYA